MLLTIVIAGVLYGLLLQEDPQTGMLPATDWSSDVLPQVQEFLGNGLIQGAMISLAAIAVAVLGARAVIGIFWGRHN
jgi:hypothetical protein